MNSELPRPLKLAQKEAYKSSLKTKVGAVLVLRKNYLCGHNKKKTHTEFANPSKHIRKSLHAELDCLNRSQVTEGSTIYVYREVDSIPAMARPCNHCMGFLKEAGVERIVYTIPHEPYWEEESIN